MSSEPTDIKLYEKVKNLIYSKYRTHSAYRSGMIVKNYKTEFLKKYGKKISPYKTKYSSKKGLSRWFLEKWTRDKKGHVGYQKKGDVYRPLVRVTKKTPVTWFELSEYQIRKAKKEKKETGHVKKFKK